MADVYLWNAEANASVRASRLREIAIYPQNGSPAYPQKVVGWYNKEECFQFGHFRSYEDAKAFVDNLHRQIRGD